MGISNDRKISFLFQMLYGITLLICSSFLYVKTNELDSLFINGSNYNLNGNGNAYGKNKRMLRASSESERVSIIQYNTQLYLQDYYIFCEIAWFYFAYILLTFLFFDICELHKSLSCAGEGSFNAYCRSDNPAIVFFGRLILNLILVFYTLIVFIEIASIWDNANEDAAKQSEFDKNFLGPAIAQFLAIFFFLPCDYYFGFISLNKD